LPLFSAGFRATPAPCDAGVPQQINKPLTTSCS
jgi:hypothetical protein